VPVPLWVGVAFRVAFHRKEIVLGAAGLATGLVAKKLYKKEMEKRTSILGDIDSPGERIDIKEYGSQLHIPTNQKYYDRETDKIVSASKVSGIYQKYPVVKMGPSAIRSKHVMELQSRFVPVSKRSHLSETQSVPGSRNVRQVATKFPSPRVGMTYCKRHRKHDMCKRYNIS
jgi:hypothetical protein